MASEEYEYGDRFRNITNANMNQGGTICAHSFSNLTHSSPLVFLYLLKECYVHGTLKATKKFRALQQQVMLALHNSPQPGPSSFIIHCLYLLPIFDLHCEGLSHLIISSLRRYLKATTSSLDDSKAANLAANLFIDIVLGLIKHDERIGIKILEVFDVRLTNIESAFNQFKDKNDFQFDTANSFLEQYIFTLIESQSYTLAVALLERFSIRQSGQSFLIRILEHNEFMAAEKWATFMGKPMLCTLIEEYVKRNKLKFAYEIIKKNNLQPHFPDVYRKCKESMLRNLAEKALWDVAEKKAKGDSKYIEYLVYLAMEAGYYEKVDELCDRYSLEGFSNNKEPSENLQHSRYLHLNQLGIEDVVWVDDADGLLEATRNIEEHKLIGLDCEWKPNYVKGMKPNKVSIMQIATDKMVFILDLIKLFADCPEFLDHCLTRILQSPGILKLGYNFQCDTKQLAQSYGKLNCFMRYNMLLDIQSMFKELRGGLSGLAEKILGTGLNKTRRNSNWELRPLSQNQLEYAALDAVVLIHIFRVGSQSQSNEGHVKNGWKSHIISLLDNSKKEKKESKTKKDQEIDPN
ncbi:hypothetical protein ACFE04_028409 [Oxalis oulophora]